MLPRWLLPACLLAGLLSAPGCHHGSDAQAEAETEDASGLAVRAVAAETRSLEETLDGIGRSEALPAGLVTLTPAVQGHVESIAVELGDFVHRGDVIVELDKTVAEADVAERQANRDTLQAAWDLLRAEPRPEDRRGLEIAVEQAKAAVARTQAALDRLQPLKARQEVSAAQLYEAEQALLQSQLQQRSAEAQLQLLLVGPRPEAVEEGKARLEAAEGALALAKAHLALHTIRSPIDGVLDSLACHPGQTVAAGTAIGEIVDSRQLNVVVWLPPTSAARVKVGQTVRCDTGPQEAAVESDAAKPDASEPEAANQPEEADEDGPKAEAHAEEESHTGAVTGKVASIGRIVDPQTGNLPIRVLVDNADGRIAVGQTLPVTIVVHEHVDELVVPSTALVDLGEGPLVLVVREGKVVQLHPTAVATHGPWTIVSGTDLAPGEPVVIEGGFNLPEGTPVRIEAEPPAVAEARQ
ncbi:MAG TPA: efflux RND transporter periplasmic adaptor subunit [Pirellulales bacterium]|nr:efflux RND transporter periplasmic adaptor subunit [Pirellulales bacterium]